MFFVQIKIQFLTFLNA